jgi:hypothetical protein
MSMHLEASGLDLAKDNLGAPGAELNETDDRADAPDLVHFLENVSTFLARRDEAA